MFNSVRWTEIGRLETEQTHLSLVLRGPFSNYLGRDCRSFGLQMPLGEIEDLRISYDKNILQTGSFDFKLSMDEEGAMDILERSLEVKDGHVYSPTSER